MYVALQLSFPAQPIPKSQERRVSFAYQSVGQVPALVFSVDDRKWSDQTTRCQSVADIGELSYGNSYSIESSLNRHYGTFEQYLARWLYWRA
jgi:hypothetical protein